MVAQGKDAYCTLLVTDDYLPGAVVLAHSLRDNGTKKPLVALVTMDTLSADTIQELQTVYDQIIPVDRIVNKHPANLYLMQRPDLSSTFTKIALWRQTQFRRIVYLDSDVVALRAPDELFARESSFAAAPDVGWPDCFNSGMMALSPNMGDYYALLALAQRGISFDGADQGLLNMHFANWDRLSFTYNCTPSGHYQYVPAYKHFHSSISAIHFIGKDKPWQVGREAGGSSGVYEELLGRWWSVYDKHYRYPTTAYIAGQSQSTSRVVQQYVTGEADTSDYGYSSIPIVLEPNNGSKAPASTDVPIGDRSDIVESIEKDDFTPTATMAQRQFSAPQSEWDPIRQPPPPGSRPEAANFPTQQYTMSDDTKLFQAPKSYPRPPRDMYYSFPQAHAATERPKPIFPWEATQAKPTRIFPEDIAIPETLSGTESESAPSNTDTETTDTQPETPATPTIQLAQAEPFSSFSRTNAWDEMPAIDRYVNAFNAARRGSRPPPLYPSATSRTNDTVPPLTDDLASPQAQRRPSLRLTDFPTEFERPSLPVTPAPVRRPLFWGQERDAAGELPPAEGVPPQQDWDPLKKLEELQRRQSEVLAQGPTNIPTDLPIRQLPGGAEKAVLLPTSEETDVPMTSVSVSAANPKVSSGQQGSNVGAAVGEATPPHFFSDMKFEPSERSGADEGVFSPTET